MQLTGEAEGARRQAIGLGEAKATEALGLARAIGFDAQKEALGGPATAVVAVANAVADGHITVVPEVLVTGGGGGSIDGLAATLMRYLGTNGSGGGNGTRTADPPAGLPTPVETAEVTRDESEGALGTERSDEQPRRHALTSSSSPRP